MFEATARARVAGTGLFGPFVAAGGQGRAPDAELESDDDRLRRLDRVTRLCLRGAAAALADAGVAPGAPARDAMGVCLGNAYGAYETNLAHQRLILEQGGRAASPAVFSHTLANVAAGWVSIVEGLKGPLTTFASGPLASAEAVARAAAALAADGRGALLAGGAHALEPDVRRVLDGARGAAVAPVRECAAFLVLEAAADAARGVFVQSFAFARAPGVPDPLDHAIAGAGGLQGLDAVLAAGDAARDPELLLRLGAPPETTALSLRALEGDLGECAPAAGAVLAVRWIQGSWAPPEGPRSVRRVLLAGLDPCGRRAFAIRFVAR